ncbi:hypothetical protein [Dactylosporangium sp. NPDC050588]|uniref:hypothetical protein n=1 Tax=Dactylosporangium sp. NPDC050588 TaxID=3157211 RepID=UPI0033F3147C
MVIAREFLFALHRLDLSGVYVFNRQVDAAYTHASGRKRRPQAWMADTATATADGGQALAAAATTEDQTEIVPNNVTPGRYEPLSE